MKATHLVVLAVGCLALLVACRSDDPSDGRVGNQSEPFGVANSGKVHSASSDRLEWLVGKWRCVERRWLSPVEQPKGSHGEHLLEYFNVYLPYADEHLTLNLTRNPDDRPIAAEFLVREEDHPPFSRGSLVPMYPSGLVGIGTNRICVGDPFNRFEFQYSVDRKATAPRLRLESKHMFLEFERVSRDAGDLKKSRVVAPVTGYSNQQLNDLRQKYETLPN